MGAGSEPGQVQTPAHHAPRKMAMGVGVVDHTRFWEVVVRRGRTHGQKQAFFVLGCHPKTVNVVFPKQIPDTKLVRSYMQSSLW